MDCKAYQNETVQPFGKQRRPRRRKSEEQKCPKNIRQAFFNFIIKIKQDEIPPDDIKVFKQKPKTIKSINQLFQSNFRLTLAKYFSKPGQFTRDIILLIKKNRKENCEQIDRLPIHRLQNCEQNENKQNMTKVLRKYENFIKKCFIRGKIHSFTLPKMKVTFQKQKKNSTDCSSQNNNKQLSLPQQIQDQIFRSQNQILTKERRIENIFGQEEENNYPLISEESGNTSSISLMVNDNYENPIDFFDFLYESVNINEDILL